MKKRILCIFLSALLIISLLPVGVSADASSDSRLPDQTIAMLKAKFPDGKYWNHLPGTPNDPDGYTDTPCDHHGSCGSTGYTGACGCNSYDRAIQCMGFAYKLAHDTFGRSARYWDEISSDNYKNDVKAGDIARITMSSSSGHSIFITAVSGNTITYADANYDQGCGIRWGATISRDRFNQRLIYILRSPAIDAPDTPELSHGTDYVQHDTVTVSWSAIELIDHYEITVSCDGSPIAEAETMDSSYTFEAKYAGEYSISVTAVNPAGRSDTAEGHIHVISHVCASEQYTDVPNYGDWAHEGIDYVISNGLFNGISSTEFAPEEPMTRAMIATVLWRDSGAQRVHMDNPYLDVDEAEWFCEPVLWATYVGLMNGVGNRTFAPNEVLTREQLVTVLYRYAGLHGFNTSARAPLTGFADGAYVSSWAVDAMQWAVAVGIINGSPEMGLVYITPHDGATRAQGAAILMRYIRDVVPILQ